MLTGRSQCSRSGPQLLRGFVPRSRGTSGPTEAAEEGDVKRYNLTVKSHTGFIQMGRDLLECQL